MVIDTKTQIDRRVMSLSAYSIQGKRNHMEDSFDVSFQMKPADQRKPYEWPYEFFYFGIFDGHGGSEAARFAKKNLRTFITQQEDFWSHDDQDVMRAISKGFADTHAAMRQDMVRWPRTSKILPSTAGTTASILFIKNGKFYTGHVGDSRIVIGNENQESKQWISHQLTNDHKPESKQEIERIQRAGGEVKNKVGVPRVVWKKPVFQNLDNMDYLKLGKLRSEISSYPLSENIVDCYHTIPFLAIARSLGDFWSLNPYSGQYIVSPEPDVACRPIDPNDKSILLATDGLWNVVGSGLAIRYLQELSWKKGANKSKYDQEYFATDNFYDVAGEHKVNHAMSLVYIAYQIWERRRQRADNISAVVVMLHNLAKYCRPPTGTNEFCARITDEWPHYDEFGMGVNAYRLEDTFQLLARIGLNREPVMDLFSTRYRDEKWDRFKEFLVLPPTVLEQEKLTAEERRSISFPKNYIRLSWAGTRRILFNDAEAETIQREPNNYNNDTEELNKDSYIQIKSVTDDPADKVSSEIRLNKSGKKVRDSSAQATQSIHDFGQPWNQLMIDDDEHLKERDPNIIFDPEDDYYFFDKIYSDDEPEMESNELLADEKDELDSECDTAPDYMVFESNNEVSTDGDVTGENRPQFRCLMNYTTPLRRSTRNSKQSVSDNVKQKEQVNLCANDEFPKLKRRKSQPVRGIAART